MVKKKQKPKKVVARRVVPKKRTLPPVDTTARMVRGLDDDIWMAMKRRTQTEGRTIKWTLNTLMKVYAAVGIDAILDLDAARRRALAHPIVTVSEPRIEGLAPTGGDL